MDKSLHNMRAEIWGGAECTINRLGDTYFDQLEMNGHYTQLLYLNEICKLGISKLRLPILWERHANNPVAWEYTRKQLQVLHKHKVEPIAGLLHHGSGPSFTELSDPDFPVHFARYAKEVAMTFPQIRLYTPINEPLTTARFSGLYGFWYPHQKDEKVFAIILLNQLKGIVLAMQAIREINPQAQLVQTEDLSKIHSTDLLSYQALFENSRRWWTCDFLTGKVDQQHPAWIYFSGLGISENELHFFLKNNCPPAVAGFNYYVTSERYLDENISDYPPSLWGGNAQHVYVDTEAVRSGHHQGLKLLLTEAWERYHIPLALTECHLGCTREQQMRWFIQQYTVVRELTDSGIPVKAITAWALLGAIDWNSLVTKNNGYYEPGAFSLRDGLLRPTALSSMIRTICKSQDYDHPVLHGKGWWQDNYSESVYTQPIVILTQGSAEKTLLKVCKERDLQVVTIEMPGNFTFSEMNVWELTKAKNGWAVAYLRMINGYHDIQFYYRNRRPALEVIAPDWNAAIINEALDLLVDGESGVWQLAANYTSLFKPPASLKKRPAYYATLVS